MYGHFEPSDRLIVDFLGTQFLAVRELAFGRSSELVLDAFNQYLHGEAGRFVLEQARWFVHNTGSVLHFRLLHQTGLVVELPPLTTTSVPPGHGRIRITAGPTSYEFDYFLDPIDSPPQLVAGRTGTLFYGRRLTPAQTDYAVSLAEPRLRGIVAPLPTHATIAAQWGVEPRTVSRTFEQIRERLRREQVRGIETQEGLVEYLVVNRIITLEQLEDAQLSEPGGPRRRAAIESSGGVRAQRHGRSRSDR